MQFLQFHTSANGDRWLLARNDSSEGFVRHEANSASGGNVSNVEICRFLDGNASAPECKALLRLIGSLVVDEPVAGGRFGAAANSDGEQAEELHGPLSAVSGPL